MLKVNRRTRLAAWSIHLFTASGAVLGLFSIEAIHNGRFMLAFWLMGMTVVIDSMDGSLARRTRVDIGAPSIDGALLDNIVDYLNYVIVPAFFLLVTDLLPEDLRGILAGLIALASAYQFSQKEAKTGDHFFKGFPSYWNIVVFYLFLWRMPQWVNVGVLLALTLLVFVPIKYIHPSRMDFLTPNRRLRQAMLAASIIYGIATLALLWMYPDSNRFWVAVSVGYVILYFAFSIYRTLVPLPPAA